MVWTQRVRDALVRTYATTTKIPKHFAYQDKRKGFSERKTFLFNKYQRMMRENELVVLFHAENLNVKLLSEIRRQVSHIKVPDADLARLEALNHGAPWTWPASAFTMARTGLLRPVCRRDTAESIQALEPYLHGQMAMLTCPVLSPEYVGKVLRAIERPVTAAANDVDPKSEKKAPLLRPLVAVAERARVIDATTESFVFEITGRSTKIEKFIQLMSPIGLTEVCRTGVSAMSRGREPMIVIGEE